MLSPVSYPYTMDCVHPLANLKSFGWKVRPW